MLNEGFGLGFRASGAQSSSLLLFNLSLLSGSPFLASVQCSLGPAFRSVCVPYTEARKGFRIDHFRRPRYKMGLFLGLP